MRKVGVSLLVIRDYVYGLEGLKWRVRIRLFKRLVLRMLGAKED